MVDFRKIIKKQKAGQGAKQLSERLAKEKEDNSFVDDRVWKYTLDKAGNAFAVLRFLPASEKDIEYVMKNDPNFDEENDTVPFYVVQYSHRFREKKGFYSICHTTFGERGSCPVCQYNNEVINDAGGDYSAIPETSKIKNGIRKRSRRTTGIANVYVVKDTGNPENEGKVFLWKFGKTVLDYIDAKVLPKFGEEPIDPSDFFNGCNFKLKLYKRDGQVKYDMCEWDSQSALSEDIDEIEKIWKQCYFVREFVDKDSLREEPEKVKQRLDDALGIKRTTTAKIEKAEKDDFDDVPFDVENIKPTATTESENFLDDETEDFLASLLE